MARSPRKTRTEKRITGLLGVGLDGEKGEHRITRGPDFLLVGGSQSTHERMQEAVLHVHDHLRKEGKRMQDVPAEIVEELLREGLDKTR
ncbi:MAG: hypothetical protein C4297_07240 [Gemmataceae bacterium]